MGQNRQGPKRAERWKDKREGARGNQYKQREVMERDWARKAKENRKEKEEEKRGRRGEGRKQISYLRKPPRCWAPKHPQTRPLLPPSPPDRPLPLCPARAGSSWFPCGRFIFKNADAVPRPALTLWPQGPQPSPGTPPSCGEGRRGERRQAAPGQQETPALEARKRE